MATASSYPSCSDLSDIKPFFKKKGLFLKPLVKINVSIQLPKNKSTEYSISNHALIEAVKELAQPDEFCSIKTTKTAVDLVRLEAEVEVPQNIKWIIPRIEGQTIKLPGQSDNFRARASMAKNDFPSRHDWDSFFRDAKHMNELKAGERPDTIHIQDLPIEWFTTKASNGKPNEKLVCRMFEQFGAIAALDIPSNDPYRSQMKGHISGMKQFNFRTTSLFEVYIQYKDYLSFVAAMDALRGMKLLKKDGEKAWTQVIKVDFDKSKHLSESSIRKRKLLREKLMEKERQNEERCEEVVDNVVQSKMVSETQDEREDEPRHDEESTGVDVSLRKILREEKLFLFAQRKLESIRLLGELLERVADKKCVSGNARPEKRTKQKSVVSMIKQSTSSLYADREDEELLNSSFNSADSLDGPLYNRAEDFHWRGRGRGFMNNRRGRGRPMRRGGDFFNPHRNNAWEDYNEYNNQSGEGTSYNSRGGDNFNSRGEGYNSHGDGYNSRGDGFNSRGSGDFNNWRGGRGQRFNNNYNRGRGRAMRDLLPMPGFSRKDQELNEYNYQMHAMYYRYFQNLTRDGKSRSRSRSYSRDRGRSRSRSRHRSSSRGRDRSRSRHRSSSRGRDRSRSRHRSSSRGRDRSRSRKGSSSRGRDRHRSSRDRSKSRHRSSSKNRERSKSRSRSRNRKSRSRSKSHKRSKSRSKSRRRSRSWTSTKRSKSRSRSWSQRRSPSATSSSKNRLKNS
uniref:A-kinase anchor protein 17A n=2 Tax=Lygus hesperus TaxID=30085 RepID=A0A0A9W0N1_LYGHE